MDPFTHTHAYASHTHILKVYPLSIPTLTSALAQTFLLPHPSNPSQAGLSPPQTSPLPSLSQILSSSSPQGIIIPSSELQGASKGPFLFSRSSDPIKGLS